MNFYKNDSWDFGMDCNGPIHKLGEFSHLNNNNLPIHQHDMYLHVLGLP